MDTDSISSRIQKAIWKLLQNLFSPNITCTQHISQKNLNTTSQIQLNYVAYSVTHHGKSTLLASSNDIKVARRSTKHRKIFQWDTGVDTMRHGALYHVVTIHTTLPLATRCCKTLRDGYCHHAQHEQCGPTFTFSSFRVLLHSAVMSHPVCLDARVTYPSS